MSLLNLNIRGLGNLQSIFVLKRFVNSKVPNLVFLMETIKKEKFWVFVPILVFLTVWKFLKLVEMDVCYCFKKLEF